MSIEEDLKNKLEEANAALEKLKLLYDIADKEHKAVLMQNNSGIYNPNSFLTREYKVDINNYEGNS